MSPGERRRVAVDDEPLSEEAIRGIEEALKDIRAGRLYPEEDIEREFGVNDPDHPAGYPEHYLPVKIP